MIKSGTLCIVICPGNPHNYRRICTTITNLIIAERCGLDNYKAEMYKIDVVTKQGNYINVCKNCIRPLNDPTTELIVDQKIDDKVIV